MCHPGCVAFARTNLTPEEVRGKSVLEVGARDVNGSVRPMIEALGPSRYVGVDIESGPGVDLICDAGDLRERFGDEAFDVLISTEVLEHVRDWRRVISNFKHVVKPNGVLVITTRSKGFRYHAYPHDYWRYEIEDMRALFSDLSIEALEKDPEKPGVFMSARKPHPFTENDLTDYRLYSIVTRKPALTVSETALSLLRARRFLSRRVLLPIKSFLKTITGQSRKREAASRAR
jgi:SAM-dependent methyltransferase